MAEIRYIIWIMLYMSTVPSIILKVNIIDWTDHLMLSYIKRKKKPENKTWICGWDKIYSMNSSRHYHSTIFESDYYWLNRSFNAVLYERQSSLKRNSSRLWKKSKRSWLKSHLQPECSGDLSLHFQSLLLIVSCCWKWHFKRLGDIFTNTLQQISQILENNIAYWGTEAG